MEWDETLLLAMWCLIILQNRSVTFIGLEFYNVYLFVPIKQLMLQACGGSDFFSHSYVMCNILSVTNLEWIFVEIVSYEQINQCTSGNSVDDKLKKW